MSFRGVFLGSLVPIAFVYVLAHYLTYLLVQAQFASRCSPTPTAVAGICSGQPGTSRGWTSSART